METTIKNQINRFLINCFIFELELKKLGSIKIKTAIKKIAGIIWSRSIYQPSQKLLAFSKNFLILGFDFSFSICLNFSSNSFCSLFKEIGTSVFS